MTFTTVPCLFQATAKRYADTAIADYLDNQIAAANESLIFIVRRVFTKVKPLFGFLPQWVCTVTVDTEREGNNNE